MIDRPPARRDWAPWRAWGLEFAAAAFGTDPQTGAAAFLEMNGMPMFAAFDQVGDGRPTRALVDWLGAP